MIVQIDDDIAFVDSLKEHTGNATASKAYKFAARQYLAQSEQIENLTKELSVLKGRMIYHNTLIKKARQACTSLLENTGQEDLFHGDQHLE